MATETVDLNALSAKTAELLKEARDDFEASLERVQDVIDSIAWKKMRSDTLIGEIGEITFEDYESVVDLVNDISYTPIRQQELLETDIQKSKKHVFISPSLDAAESAVTKITTSAGAGEFKNLTGVYLTDAMREALRAGQEAADLRRHNDLLALIQKYPTSDQVGNEAWLTEQYGRLRADRDRNVFSTLFAMAQGNVKWAFQNGIAIEQLHESFTARYNRLFYDITAANIAAYKAEVRGNILWLEAELAEIDAKMKVEALKFDAESSEWKLLVDQANSRLQSYVQEYSGKMSRNLKMINTRMVGGKNVADGYKSIYSAYSSQYSGVSLSNSSE